MQDSDRILALAQACDRIWTADGGLDRARQLDLEPACHLGDNDSLSAAGLAYLEDRAIAQLKFPIKKDEPDSALALRHLLAAEYAWRQSRPHSNSLPRDRAPFKGPYSTLPGSLSGIIFLAGLGRRMDHVLANLDLASRFVRPDLPFLLTDGQTDLWTLQGPCQLKLALPGGRRQDSYISLLAASPQVTGVNLQQVMWPLEGRKLFQGINLGISNQPLYGEAVELSLESGILRVILTSEDKDQVKLQP
ncbi:MAG: thiamine diphosphokinase [Eubacteriales bacterium]|nr:thiamine diphosphokinase [Eubacteriales bacterium]